MTTISYADDNAMQKYKNYTPQQIQDMQAEVRKSSVPMAYIFAAQRGLSEGSELLFGMELNRLMYSGIHDYKNAVKAFQDDLGDKPRIKVPSGTIIYEGVSSSQGGVWVGGTHQVYIPQVSSGWVLP